MKTKTSKPTKALSLLLSCSLLLTLLTPSALESAWQMDVVGWLRSLGDVWQE